MRSQNERGVRVTNTLELSRLWNLFLEVEFLESYSTLLSLVQSFNNRGTPTPLITVHSAPAA
jgi:hypothetical protein